MKTICSMQKKIESLKKNEKSSNRIGYIQYKTPSDAFNAEGTIVDYLANDVFDWDFQEQRDPQHSDYILIYGKNSKRAKKVIDWIKQNTDNVIDGSVFESYKKSESAASCSFYDEFIAERAREILEAYDVNDAQGGDAWNVLNNGDVLDIDREDSSGFISYNDGGVRKQWFASMFSIGGQGVGDEKADKYYDSLWQRCADDYEAYCKEKGITCNTDSEDFYDYEDEWFSDEYCDIFADAEIWLYSGDRGSFGDRGTYTLHCRINRSFNHNGLDPEDDLDVFMKLDASQLTKENADKFFAAVEGALANYTFSKGYKEIEVKAD